MFFHSCLAKPLYSHAFTVQNSVSVLRRWIGKIVVFFCVCVAACLFDKLEIELCYFVAKQQEKGVSITKFDLMSNTPSHTPASSPWVMTLSNGSSTQQTRRLPVPLQQLQERQQRLPPPQPSTSKPGTWLQSMAVPNNNKEMIPNINQSTATETLMRRGRAKISAEPPSSPHQVS